MYFPLRGSQTTIWLLGSKPDHHVSLRSTTILKIARLTLEGKVADLEALVRALLGRDDGGVADERVVDTGVGDQVSLELVQVDVESSIEAQARSDGADDLSNETVEMLVVGARNVQATAADVIDSLVVNKERAIRVLNSAVGRQNSIVGLDDGGGDAGSGIHGKFELALLAVVGREALEEEGSEARSCTTAERVEDQETLEGGAVVCSLSAPSHILCLSILPATRRMRSITLSTISFPMV
jgi:hypothetical protein